jgi:hypothetical protein
VSERLKNHIVAPNLIQLVTNVIWHAMARTLSEETELRTSLELIGKTIQELKNSIHQASNNQPVATDEFNSFRSRSSEEVN